MSADLLRRAAAKLREHAKAASLAPWDSASDGLVWPDRTGDPVSGSTEVEDADYIALMHPPVALALADWLDSAARDAEEIGPDPFALRAARAVLREDPS